ETLNLAIIANDPDFLRVSQIYEGLWQLSGTRFGAVSQLVDSWETNKDATLFTFKLRPNVTWHDGKPFTAAAGVRPMKLWRKNLSVVVVTPFIDFGAVRSRDSLTVEIPLHRGLVDLPTVLAGNWGSYIIQDGTHYAKARIGTGPFRLDSFEPGMCVMSANKEY